MPLSLKLNAKTALLATSILALLSLIIIGSCLCRARNGVFLEKVENVKTIDYTDCIKFDLNINLPKKTCRESIQEDGQNKPCFCQIDFTLRSQFTAPVFYYKLVNYDLSSIWSSRDTNQLLGNLTSEPSDKCEPYRFDNSTGTLVPIVPCGAMADSMFNDTINIKDNEGSIINMESTYGIVSEENKSFFKNPPGDLSTAFSNYSKPKNWRTNIYELNKNGLESEPFIAWMQTNPKSNIIMNPLMRLDKTLNPDTPYTLKVNYDYPLSRYNNTREIVIISTSYVNVTGNNNVQRNAGIAAMVLGVIGFGCLLCYYLYFERLNSNKNEDGENESRGLRSGTVST